VQSSEFKMSTFESLSLQDKEKLNGFCGKMNNIAICLLNENILKYKNFYKTIDQPENENDEDDDDEED